MLSNLFAHRRDESRASVFLAEEWSVLEVPRDYGYASVHAFLLAILQA